MPTIDFSIRLKDMNGEDATQPLYKTDVDKQENVIQELKPLTLGYACMMALNNMADKPDSEASFVRGQLSFKIRTSKDKLSVKTEEVVLLKKLSGTTFMPDVVFQIHNLLEGRPQFGPLK